MKFNSIVMLFSCVFVYSGAAYGMDQQELGETLKQAVQQSKALTKQYEAAKETFQETDRLTQQLLSNPEAIQRFQAALQQNPEALRSLRAALEPNPEAHQTDPQIKK